MLRLIFPPKCVLCDKILAKVETDLCHQCRTSVEMFKRAKRKIPNVAHWTALWYYKGNVRNGIHRFKFRRRASYAPSLGRLLAPLLLQKDADLITWVPVSKQRRAKRGYDQSHLLARYAAKALGLTATRLLKKIRHTPPQSGIHGAALRRANVFGAYQAVHTELLQGKRIWLLDDVVTTGATASECARTLLSAGAKEVYVAAIGAAEYYKK